MKQPITQKFTIGTACKYIAVHRPHSSDFNVQHLLRTRGRRAAQRLQ